MDFFRIIIPLTRTLLKLIILIWSNLILPISVRMQTLRPNLVLVTTIIIIINLIYSWKASFNQTLIITSILIIIITLMFPIPSKQLIRYSKINQM